MSFRQAIHAEVEISVVIPLFREGDHISESLKCINCHLEKLGKSYEFVLVDDGSPDNTWQEITSIIKQFPAVQAFRFSRNFGKESAMSAGLEHARGKAVIVMDGDLQHPPELIAEMVRLWEEEGYEVVDAVKTSRGREALWYKIFAKTFTFFICKLSGFDLAGASDYKLLDRKVVNAWLDLKETETFYRGMTEWLGFRHARVPMQIVERTQGQSAWSLFRLVHLALNGLTAFSAVPLHLVTLLGCIYWISALILGTRALMLWFTDQSIAGFPTVILLQLFTGGGIMVGLGVIGEYLSRIYREIKRRPRYIVKDQFRSADS